MAMRTHKSLYLCSESRSMNGQVKGIHIRCRNKPEEWAARILHTIDHDTKYLGFSEYVAYASWVQHRHSETVRVEREANWRRFPPRGRLDIALIGWLRKDKLCCPTRLYLRYRTRQGIEYVGWEIAHACNMGDGETYGLSSHLAKLID